MLNLQPTGPIPEAPKQFECPLCLETIGRKALIAHLRREHQAVHTGAFSFVPDHDMIQGSLTCRHCYSTFTMEQALITHFKRGSCPVLMCQWAKAQHFGPTLTNESDHRRSKIDHTPPALLHRFFDLSQAGREYDLTPPAFDLVSLWFPMVLAPCWTPLKGVTWFRSTTDWLSHFPEMLHTNFVIDQAFAMIRVLGHHPPLAWAWTLDTDTIPQQQWHEASIHECTHDQLAIIKHILGQLTQILAQNDLHQLTHPADDGLATDRGRSSQEGFKRPRHETLSTGPQKNGREQRKRNSTSFTSTSDSREGNLIQMLGRLVLRQEDTLNQLGLDRSLMIFLQCGKGSLMPSLLEQGKRWNAQKQAGETTTSLRQTMFQAMFTEPSRQAEPDGKRRRIGPGPQGQRDPDRGSEMAILVMEPGSQSSTAEPEDSSDVGRRLSDTPSDPSAGRESQFGAEVCSLTTFDARQSAAGRRHSHSMEAGREPSWTRSTGTSYAPAQACRQRHYTTHPYEDEADHVAEIATSGCNLPQIAQVLRGIMTTSLVNPGSTCYLNSTLLAQVWTTLLTTPLELDTWGAWTQPILCMFTTHAGEAHNPCQTSILGGMLTEWFTSHAETDMTQANLQVG